MEKINIESEIENSTKGPVEKIRKHIKKWLEILDAGVNSGGSFLLNDKRKNKI